LGTEHPDVARSYNNIGSVFNHQGEYAKALEYHGKAMAIWKKVLGTEHPEVATSYNNIGVVYDNLGDYVKALEYYDKALAIRENVLGTDHPYTKRVRDKITDIKSRISDSQSQKP
jgi:tetratricopeptide (TPR) repeat protein